MVTSCNQIFHSPTTNIPAIIHANMNYRKYIIYTCCTLLFFCFASVSVKADRVPKAYKKLQKNKPEKAKLLLDKELKKSPQHAGAKYVYALYFLKQNNPFYHLDSAYAYVLAAGANYNNTKSSDKKKWRKIGITPENILKKKQEIDSLAFVLASDSNHIQSYQYFIDHYPTASQKAEAIERRNNIAFAQAQRANTYESYKIFLDTYPDARQAREAKELYELMLFEFQTQDKDIDSYETFISLYPDSPFRKEAERHIFEMFTAPHTSKIYHDFIKKYPQSAYLSRAWHWLYSLYKEEQGPEDFLKIYPDFFDSAYANKLIAAEKLVYFPVYEDEKYGFVDVNGTLQIPIQFDSVAADYFCEGVKDDFILVYNNGKLAALNKAGEQIIDHTYQSVEQLEGGLLKVQKDNKAGVFHQAGFRILPAQYNEIEVLDDIFLKISQNNQQGLMTMNGRSITPICYDEINSLGEGLLLFKKDGKYALSTQNNLLHGKDTVFQYRYDQVEWIKKGFIRAQADKGQTILTTSLKEIIPLTTAQINVLPAGWALHTEGQIQLYNLDGLPLSDSVFTEVAGNASFYAVKKNNRWAVLQTNGNWYDTLDFDSVILLGNDLFIAQQKNTMYVSLQGGKLTKLGDFTKVSLQRLPQYPEQVWLLLENKAGKKGIYSIKTGNLLPARYDDIQIWEPDLYRTQLKGKYGLINPQGKMVLPAVYDGLNYQPDKYMAVLKNGKFGLMHLQDKVTIPAQYSTLLKKYDKGGKFFIAGKEGKYGLISVSNQPLSDFVFDEIRFWQYEVALVKQNETWYLYDFVQRRFLFKPMEYIQYVKEEADEIVLKVYIDKMYGILSSAKGLLIDCEYEDLVNVGSEAYPLYLAEKYIDDADVHLVYYINREGKAVRKQLFDQKKYNRILCE